MPASLAGGWRDLAFEHFRDGIDRPLAAQGKRRGTFGGHAEIPAGRRVPRHRHAGLETIVVLEGMQSDESGDYAAGTVVLNPVGTRALGVDEGGLRRADPVGAAGDHPWRGQMSDIRFDIQSLHAAYAVRPADCRGRRNGVRPHRRQRRSRHLHPSRRQGGSHGASRGRSANSTPWRSRSGACLSPSRTISTSRACRPPPLARTMPICRRRTRPSWRC